MNEENKHYKNSPNPSVNNEISSGKSIIDLVELASVLSRSFKFIMVITIGAFLTGLLVASLTTKHWISSAIVAPINGNTISPLSDNIAKLSLLNINFNMSSDDLFLMFKKEFNSSVNLNDFFRDSGSKLSGNISISRLLPFKNDPDDKANKDIKDNYALTYTSANLNETQNVLSKYIDYVNAEVNKQVNLRISNSIGITRKVANSDYEFSLKKAKGMQQVDIKKLEYAASIALAAGIKKPISDSINAFSKDYDSIIPMGYDAINRQLEIVRSINDLTTVDSALLNDKLYLDELNNLKIEPNNISSFLYLQEPTAPVSQGAKFKALIVILFSFVGFVSASCIVLFRYYAANRKCQS